MNNAQLEALRVVLGAARDECEHGLLGNLLENHLKVVALEALLHAGYSVMEGTNRAGMGTVLTVAGGKLSAAMAVRPPMAAAPGSSRKKNSPDIRVWHPVKLIIELQVRSLFGSLASLSSDNVLDDVQRVGRGTADAIVLAFDRTIYDSLRGLKTDPRGRPAKHPLQFNAAFPDSASLAPTVPSTPQSSLVPFFEWLGASVTSAAGIERVVLALWKK